MKIRMLSEISVWKNYRGLHTGKIYEMPPEDAQRLIKNKQAEEVTTEFLGEGARKRIETETKKPTLANFTPERLEEPTPGEKPKPMSSPAGAFFIPLPVPEEKKELPKIDPTLIGWLVQQGFVREPKGVAYIKQDKVGEDLVKLQVDFSDDPRGMRYGYRLNLQIDPPEWKSDKALRDHPTLLEFKAFRDKLLAQRETKVQTPPTAPKLVPKPVEITTAEGQVLMQREAEEMEAKDDSQIIAEMKGEFKAEILKQLFYSFESGGRTVVGLSYKGVKQMAMRQGHIETKELELKETEKAWIVSCKARDKAKDLEVYGVAIQPKEMILRSGGKMSDPFALTKAVSKSQRNALRGLISEVVITETYKRWLEGRGGK